MPTIHYLAIALYAITLAALIIALAAAFIILLIGKLGLRDYIIERAPRLISQLFSCDFCLSFWISLILAIILAAIFGEPDFLFTPIFSTPITRMLL